MMEGKYAGVKVVWPHIMGHLRATYAGMEAITTHEQSLHATYVGIKDVGVKKTELKK